MNRRDMLLMTGCALLSACKTTSPGNVTGTEGPTNAGFPAWSGGPSLQRPKQEIYPALHNGEIWLSGGFVARGGKIIGPTNETVVLNAETGIWRDGPAMITPRHHPHLQSHDGKLYAFAGYEATGADAMWTMQKSGWRLDSDGWNDIPDLPARAGEAVTASFGGGLRLVGGRKPKGDSNKTWEDHTDTGQHFVLINGKWEKSAPLPTPRNSATSEVIGDFWHVVGGRTVAGGNSVAHEAYDAGSDKWVSRAPLPLGQGGLASGIIDGKLYAFGGEYFNDGGGVYTNTWVYTPEADLWGGGPPMKTPRHGLGGVTLNNRIYAIGGATQRGGNDTSAVVEILG